MRKSCSRRSRNNSSFLSVMYVIFFLLLFMFLVGCSFRPKITKTTKIPIITVHNFLTKLLYHYKGKRSHYFFMIRGRSFISVRLSE